MATTINLSIPSDFEGDIIEAIETAVNNVLPSISAYAIDRILQIADQKLSASTIEQYRQGFGTDSVILTPKGFAIEPSTDLAAALEEGFEAFDIKAVMLASGSVKFGKDGSPYVDVPFSHSKEGSSRGHSMTSDVDRLVRNSVRRESRAAKREGRDASSSLRVTGELPAKKAFKRNLRMGGGLVKTSVAHKTSVFSQMIRTKSAGGTQHSTIRRISANSEATAWWHPGYSGVHAIEKVSKGLSRVAMDLTKAELRNIGFIVS